MNSHFINLLWKPFDKVKSIKFFLIIIHLAYVKYALFNK